MRADAGAQGALHRLVPAELSLPPPRLHLPISYHSVMFGYLIVPSTQILSSRSYVCPLTHSVQECHCMLFLTEDNDFAGKDQTITTDEIKQALA